MFLHKNKNGHLLAINVVGCCKEVVMIVLETGLIILLVRNDGSMIDDKTAVDL